MIIRRGWIPSTQPQCSAAPQRQRLEWRQQAGASVRSSGGCGGCGCSRHPSQPASPPHRWGGTHRSQHGRLSAADTHCRQRLLHQGRVRRVDRAADGRQRLPGQPCAGGAAARDRRGARVPAAAAAWRRQCVAARRGAAAEAAVSSLARAARAAGARGGCRGRHQHARPGPVASRCERAGGAAAVHVALRGRHPPRSRRAVSAGVQLRRDGCARQMRSAFLRAAAGDVLR